MSGAYISTLTITLNAWAMSPAAANPVDAPSVTAKIQAPHCVLRLSKSKKTTESCYNTFTEGISDATGQQITDAPANIKDAVADAAFDERINSIALSKNSPHAAQENSNTVIGIEYQLNNHSGESKIIVAERACSSDTGGPVDWQIDLTGSWWDNRISSFKAYASCYVNHYQFSNYTGDDFGWTGYGYPEMGNFDNRTTSIQWT
ncbi:hypothetical protein ACFYY8_25705 [Streptosporangium sp. NPDC001559]|uniref:hypothetical protein n=1 Tax=Streptosporangium sp. NPDC001559 TaxID=3366187 RepID=UPI0036EF7D6C